MNVNTTSNSVFPTDVLPNLDFPVFTAVALMYEFPIPLGVLVFTFTYSIVLISKFNSELRPPKLVWPGSATHLILISNSSPACISGFPSKLTLSIVTLPAFFSAAGVASSACATLDCPNRAIGCARVVIPKLRETTPIDSFLIENLNFFLKSILYLLVIFFY